MTDKKLEDAFGRVRAFLWMLARGNGIVEVSSDLSREILGFYLTVEADAARQSQPRDEIVRETVERCANLVEQIAALARRGGLTLEPKDLLALAADLRSLAPEPEVKE